MEKPDSQLTPEKRLLQLIEGGQEAGGPQAPVKQKSNPFANIGKYLSPSGIQQLIQDIRSSWSSQVTDRKEFFNLGGINKILKVFLVLLAIGLLVNLALDFSSARNYDTSNFDIPVREVEDIQMSENKIFNTDLVAQADNIKVFVPYDKRNPAQVKEEKKDETSIKLVEIMSDWKLAGLSINPLDSSKSYCMIEDVKKASTSFLKIGDEIQGFRVADIKNDGIVLKFNQETLELR